MGLDTAARGLAGRVGIFVPIRPPWAEKIGGAFHALGRFFRRVKMPVSLWCSRLLNLFFVRGGATAASQHGAGLMLWALASFGLAALTGGLVTLAVLHVYSHTAYRWTRQEVLHTHTVRYIHSHRISMDIRLLSLPRLQASVSSFAPPVLHGITPSSRLPSAHSAPSLSYRAPATNVTYNQVSIGHPSKPSSAIVSGTRVRGAGIHKRGQASGMMKMNPTRLLASADKVDRARSSSSFSCCLAAELKTGEYEVTDADWETAGLSAQDIAEDAQMVVASAVPAPGFTGLLPLVFTALALLVTPLVVWRVSRKAQPDLRDKHINQQTTQAPAVPFSPKRSPRLVDKRASLPFAASEVPDLRATFANSSRTIRAAPPGSIPEPPLQFKITCSSKEALGETAKGTTITAAEGLMKHWDTRRLALKDGEAGDAKAGRADQREEDEEGKEEEEEERDLAFLNQTKAKVHPDQGRGMEGGSTPVVGRMVTGAGMLDDQIVSPVSEHGPEKGVAELDMIMTSNMEVGGTTKNIRRHSWGGSIKPRPIRTQVTLRGAHVVDKVEFFESLRMVHEAHGAHAVKPMIDHRGNRLAGSSPLHELPAEEKSKRPFN